MKFNFEEMKPNISPMMRQYIELKEKHSDCLLLFRLGDFYELFFDDAITASRELEITLTGRDCGLKMRAPMCGVPHHSADAYIARLIEKGYKVAIGEQMSDPKQTKGIVERDVVRIITPGTFSADGGDEKKNTYVMSINRQNDKLGFAVCDISTGEFHLGEISGKDFMSKLQEELSRIAPVELIVNSAICKDEKLFPILKSAYFAYEYYDWAYDFKTAEKNLTSHFAIASLSGFGCEGMKSGVGAAGALLGYLNETQKHALAHINKISVYHRDNCMVLDATTRKNLELTASLSSGSKKGTLLWILDKTKTSMGARMLRSCIAQPLYSIDKINRRLDAVDELKSKLMLRESICENLNKVYDIERLCSKIALETLNARDCLSLKSSLSILPALKYEMRDCNNEGLKAIAESLDDMDDIYRLLESAIASEPPVAIKEGGLIKQGYNKDIDRYINASENLSDNLTRLEAREREKTGIKNLKINYNKIFGHYFEVTKSYLMQVPLDYVRKQTLANCERFSTAELSELEEEVLEAQGKLVALNYEIFCQIRAILGQNLSRIQKCAALLAQIDMYSSLACVAAEYNYCRPEMNDMDIIDIKKGRHPVVERVQAGKFVPNDTLLDCNDSRLSIITGPNMAGKSTYMRQVALITLMAHIGSFVPAESAKISLVDRIFTRVGASDDLFAGSSTFMVEMNETANILNNATNKSLLILDEIGRGTSTFDGLSIAWAVAQHIADKNLIGAKTLFATHYHELSELEGLLEGVVNYRIVAKEMDDEIIFLRKIMRGGTDKSFGIQVAKLAGLPQSVIKRAKEILLKLEAENISANVQNGNSLPAASSPEGIELLLKDIKNIKTDSISPFEALVLLRDLKDKIDFLMKD